MTTITTITHLPQLPVPEVLAAMEEADAALHETACDVMLFHAHRSAPYDAAWTDEAPAARAYTGHRAPLTAHRRAGARRGGQRLHRGRRSTRLPRSEPSSRAGLPDICIFTASPRRRLPQFSPARMLRGCTEHLTNIPPSRSDHGPRRPPRHS